MNPQHPPMLLHTLLVYLMMSVILRRMRWLGMKEEEGIDKWGREMNSGERYENSM